MWTLMSIVILSLWTLELTLRLREVRPESQKMDRRLSQIEERFKGTVRMARPPAD